MLADRLKQPTPRKIRDTAQDRVIYAVIIAMLCVLLFLFIYPLYFVVIASVSDPFAVWRGEVILWPKGFSLMGYHEIIQYKQIWRSYLNSFGYVALGLAINLTMNIITAYVLSRREFMLRGLLMKLFVFTMYFSGGLIPGYLLVKNLHIYNTVWALVLPGALSTWNVIIMRTMFMTAIPNELREAALLDGCGDTLYLLRIVIPLSKAVIGVVALYYGLGHWNSYFSALIYLDNRSLYPLQLVLREILLRASAMFEAAGDEATIAYQLRIAEVVKYCVIIVASIPPLIVYPFVQNSFVKGVMIGSIKG